MTQVILEGQARVLPPELPDSKLGVPQDSADSYLCYPSCTEGQCRAADSTRPVLASTAEATLGGAEAEVASHESQMDSALQAWSLGSLGGGGPDLSQTAQLGCWWEERFLGPAAPQGFSWKIKPFPPANLILRPGFFLSILLPSFSPSLLHPSLSFSLSQIVLPWSSDWPGTHCTCRSG